MDGQVVEKILYNDTDIDAVVSPDAAYYLDILTTSEKISVSKTASSGILATDDKGGYSPAPDVEECYFAFVPASIPLGVAYSGIVAIKEFFVKKENSEDAEDWTVIGFGPWVSRDKSVTELYATKTNSTNVIDMYQSVPTADNEGTADYERGGNFKSYYDLIRTSITTNPTEYTENRKDLSSMEYGQNILIKEQGGSARKSRIPGSILQSRCSIH